ncbi:hypothetical protein BJ978_001303 [Agromyces terreus]|uniref:Glutaminase n=1 Tax=Agromyces terreus TaxID=424795 RepID=A0A9X2GXV6_9MICO|nr:hypothetical protein [Agromyces terreus]MCP2370627.1 hypothetical protein [Agromyces terreus]
MTPNTRPDGGAEPSGADAAGATPAHAAAGPAHAASLVRRLASAAASELAAADARREVLAAYTPERRVLGLPRAARMTAVAEVWRLGVLLLADDGALHGTGRVVRAERAARRSVTADSVAEQRALRAAAVKGGIAEGATVNFDTRPVDLDELDASAASGPLVVRDGAVLVRWSPSMPDALSPLEQYLADRVGLLAHPLPGA